MTKEQEERNQEAIKSFLANNDIDPQVAMGFDNKFEVRYFVGDKRKFAEETTVGFNIIGTSDVNMSFYDINAIEFETAYKISEQTFTYDEVLENLTIIGANLDKHEGEYKVIINSIYIEFA